MLTAYDYPTAKLARRGGHPAAARRRLARPVDARLRERAQRVDGRHAPPRGGRRPRGTARARRRRHAVPVATRRRRRRSGTPGRFIHDAGVQAVKVEGGVRSARVDRGARQGRHPGHGPHRAHAAVGNAIGKFRVQGKSREQARALLARRPRGPGGGRVRGRAGARPGAARGGDHRAPADPDDRDRGRGRAAAARSRSSPTCSASTTWQPKHAKPYANLRETILEAVRAYAADVEAGTFPGPEQTVRMDDAVLDEVLGRSALDASAGAAQADPRSAASRSTATSE